MNDMMISVNTLEAKSSTKNLRKLLTSPNGHRLLLMLSGFLFHLSSWVRQSLKNGINDFHQYLARYRERSSIIVSQP